MVGVLLITIAVMVVILLSCLFVFSIIKLRPKQTVEKSEAKKLGDQGEVVVSSFLYSLKNCKVLNNVILARYNNFVQIDHVLITGYGVFVIETKNYSGDVYISENDTKWRVKYENGKVYDLYNPIKQNNSHVDVVKHLLRTNRVYPMIVFPNQRCKLVGKANDVYNFDSFRYRLKKVTSGIKNDYIGVSLVYNVLSVLNKSKDKKIVKKHKNYVEGIQKMYR